VLVPLLALFACSCTTVYGPPAVTPNAPAPARYTATNTIDPGTVPDAWIVAVIDRELHADPMVSAEHIGVDSKDGIVTLQAAVTTQLAKQRAAAIPHVVRGVRAVVDRIDVVQRPRENYQLDVVVAAVLAADPATREQRIAARSQDGVVQLTGVVDSYAAGAIAISDVLGIPGVVRVTDYLAQLPRKQSNAQLAETVKRSIGDDPWVEDAHVRVAADHGKVTLDGFVGSDAEKARAEQDARLASPRELDASGLRVDQWTNDGTLRARPQRTRSDREIGQAILDAYVADPRLHPFVPAIDVREKVVILTGAAPNAEAKAAAREDAENTTGVVDVRDDMKLMSAVAQRTDEQIRTEVVDALVRDGLLRPLHLAVEVVDGTVYLRGKVPTETDRLHAIALATSARGARKVDDSLELVPRLGAASMQPR
jgi:hyperosmotically inducible protein